MKASADEVEVVPTQGRGKGWIWMLGLSFPQIESLQRPRQENVCVKALTFEIMLQKGKVYSAMIRKEDVLAMFTSRGEAEVVVDFTKLKDINLEREY